LVTRLYLEIILKVKRPDHPELVPNGKVAPHEDYYAGKWLLVPAFGSTYLHNDEFHLMGYRKFRIPFIPPDTKCGGCQNDRYD
jgi:hypothetical protein